MLNVYFHTDFSGFWVNDILILKVQMHQAQLGKGCKSNEIRGLEMSIP